VILREQEVNNTAELFIYSLIIQTLSILISVFFKDNKTASKITHLLLLAGLIAGLGNTVSALLFLENITQNSVFFGISSNIIRFDSLGLFFLFVIQLAAIPLTIYSYSFLKHYTREKKSIRSLLIVYPILLISTQITVIANHTVLFLICWEIMSTAAYLGMIFEKEKKDVQTGSFYYLVMNHVVIFLLFIFFIILHNHSKSWYFTDFHISSSSGILFIILYGLSFCAFGMKSGFMPFHSWLPKAHPIAPTIFSAFLSGIIIKTGIYGIMRTFQFINPTPLWLGWILITVSMITAIFGVWYALAQHDLKRLLAYHSVENIGIIGIGIGIGFLGSAYNNLSVQILGFGGALLHTLNHAIFKSLLFVGSGIIYQNLGTRNIEHMGGIVKHSKFFVILFLIGSIAICGLPPLNGFISEFVIYRGFFTAASELKNFFPLLMLVFTVGLALVGGLAVACFTKINSIMFLGSERKKIEKFSLTIYDYFSLGIFAFLCIAIGFFPQFAVSLVNKVLNQGFIADGIKLDLFGKTWIFISLIFIGLSALIIIIFIIKKIIQQKYGRRISPPWACGYQDITPRMQYTGSSFADELNEISKSVLLYEKEINIPKEIILTKGSFESHSSDLVESKVLLPFYRKIKALLTKKEFSGFNDMRFYVASILVIITIYSIVAFLWE